VSLCEFRIANASLSCITGVDGSVCCQCSGVAIGVLYAGDSPGSSSRVSSKVLNDAFSLETRLTDAGVEGMWNIKVMRK
jgi:hypothetical protein